VSSKVDASAFRQVHAIVTRMRTTAGRRCWRHCGTDRPRRRVPGPASAPPRYA